MAKADVVIFSVSPQPALDVPENLLADTSIRWNNRLYSDLLYQRGLGAYRVASHCRAHGYTCQVITFLTYFDQSELQYLAESFIGPHTVIAISVVFPVGHSIQPISQLLGFVRQRWPDNKIVLGGNNVLYTGLEQHQKFDAYFTGYSEQSFVEWLDQHHKKTAKRLYPQCNNCTVIDGETSLEKFDVQTLDHAWHHDDCVIEGEQIPIEIARGCIFACKFCSYRNIGKKKFDYIRDANLIKKEMIANYENHGVTEYIFSDDTFNDSTFKVQTLHDAFATLPFQLSFWCFLRLDLLHRFPEQISLLKNMGLKDAFFGIETLNHASGKSIGKGLHPDKVKQTIHDLVHVHWKDSVSFSCNLIVGLPYETEQSQLDTFAWFEQYPTVNLGVHSLFFIPGHNSSIGKDPAAYGYTFDNMTAPNIPKQHKNKAAGWINNVGMTEGRAIELAAAAMKPAGTLNGSMQFRYQYLTGGQGSLKDMSWEKAWPLVENGAKKFREQYRHKLFAVAERYRQQ